MQVSLLSIGWRLVQFGLQSPDLIPPGLMPMIPRADEHALFLAADRITDVREVRDFLHDSTQANGYYRLFGFYCTEYFKYRVERTFRGIVIAFPQYLDAMQFRLAWSAVMLRDVLPSQPLRRAA